jgi:hypothetical protein
MANTTTTSKPSSRRSLPGLLVDSAYAYVGLGSAWVEFARSIERLGVQAPRQARTIAGQAPDRLRDARDRGASSVRHLVGQGVQTTRGLPVRAGREFDDLARRGRELVGSIRGNAATREAVDRARTARSRVKAAGTSVSRAAEGAVEAAERAAGIVADRTEPTARFEVEVKPAEAQIKPPSVQVKTRATDEETTPRQARRRDTRPYEERTIEELQERAKELGIEGRSSMTKEELIDALRNRR